MMKYFYVLVLVNLVVSAIVYVPNVLFDHRYEGAATSVLLAAPIGLILMYVFLRMLMKFPNEGLPEIMEKYTPNWFRLLILFLSSIAWFLTGIFIILAYIFITTEFVNPELSIIFITIVFAAFISVFSKQSSTTLLYSMMINFTLAIPVLIFMAVKSVTKEELLVDSMIVIAKHSFIMPTLTSVGAATYILAGYVNMVIFNRVFNGELQTKYLWVVGVVALGSILFTFYIPIGVFGTEAVEFLIYPWVSTADTMNFEYFVVERVLFIFLFLYFLLAVISTTIHWHVGLELAKSIPPKAFMKKWETYFVWVLLSTVSLFLVVFAAQVKVKQLIALGSVWLQFILFAQVLVIAVLVFCARKAKKDERQNVSI